MFVLVVFLVIVGYIVWLEIIRPRTVYKDYSFAGKESISKSILSSTKNGGCVVEWSSPTTLTPLSLQEAVNIVRKNQKGISRFLPIKANQSALIVVPKDNRLTWQIFLNDKIFWVDAINGELISSVILHSNSW